MNEPIKALIILVVLFIFWFGSFFSIAWIVARWRARRYLKKDRERKWKEWQGEEIRKLNRR